MNEWMPWSAPCPDYRSQRLHDVAQFVLLLLDHCRFNFHVGNIITPPGTNIRRGSASLLEKFDPRSDLSQQRSCMNDAPIRGVEFAIFGFLDNWVKTRIPPEDSKRPS